MAGYSGGAGVAPRGGRSPDVVVRSAPARAPFVAGRGQRPQNVNRPPAPGQAHPAPSTRGHWVPQGDNWQLIHAVGRGKWAPGGVAGAKAPPRPKGPTPLPNNPLAPLTQNQIQRSATKTINSAYGPGYTELNNQTAQATNLYKAQSADDRYFAQWLQEQTQNLNTKVGTVNQQLSGVLQGFQQQQQSDLAGLQQGAAGALSGQQGFSASPGQVNAAIQGETQPMVDSANARTAAAAAQGVQNELYSQIAAQNSGEVGQARIAAQGTAQLGDLNKTLTAIAGERAKLQAGKIGDIAKEISRLQGVEISKRQWLRSQADLEQTTGIKNQVALSGAQSRATSAAASLANARTAALRASETARHNQALEDISKQRGDQSAARAAETARHDKAMEGISQQRANTAAGKAAGTAAGKKFGTPVQQKAVVNYISNLQQAIQTDAQRFHAGDPRALELAYHDVLSGRAAKQGIIIPRPPSGAPLASYLNAATNTLTGLGAKGLTPGDIAFLNSQGLQVGGRYPRSGGAPRVPSSGPNASNPGTQR